MAPSTTVTTSTSSYTSKFTPSSSVSTAKKVLKRHPGLGFYYALVKFHFRKTHGREYTRPIVQDVNKLLINWPEIDYSLTDSRIDLWLVDLSLGRSLLPHFRRLLGREEAAKAQAFQGERLRQNYTIVHGILRALVGHYLGEEPAKLRFSAGRNGKPHIVARGEVQFNLSHSDDIALFGFTATDKVGVDVEKIRPLNSFLDIAKRFFCPEETRDLMSYPPEERRRAFFRCWTRKEAYLKGVGDGLQIPLNSFRVSLSPSGPVRVLEVNGSREGTERWMMHSLEFSPSFCAAVAYPAPPRTIRMMCCGPTLAEQK